MRLNRYDVIVIGGGQSGLAVAYYLRRTGLSYVIIDRNSQSGGAWIHTWKSLRLFSPAQWSSLPGMIMTGGSDYYPTRDETIEYLKSYESKYRFPINRDEGVTGVTKEGEDFVVETTKGIYHTRAVVSATGTFDMPHLPEFWGVEHFTGVRIHSSQYDVAGTFAGKRVAVVGEGNSGAQILAEVSKVTDTIWITLKEPRFLPDNIDGRYLFDAATQMYNAQKAGKEYKPPSLGDVVMVDSVKEARARKVLNSFRPFDHFSHDSLVWADGRTEKTDAVIFCTGFRPALKHLAGLHVVNDEGRVETQGTRSTKVNGLWLVGYGNWTGFASATLIGVGRSAKKTVAEIQEYVSQPVQH